MFSKVFPQKGIQFTLFVNLDNILVLIVLRNTA